MAETGTTGSGYMTDDIDSLEISSDECLSPPIPPVRQRRNAIFERRDPPSAVSENDDDRFYQDEFEVASVSDINDNPIEDANSTSAADDEEISPTPTQTPSSLKRPLDDSSDGPDNNFADNETLRSEGESSDETHVSVQGLSTDSEISEKDKWFCSQCNAKSMPYFRYCLRCFKIRRDWLPRRPRSRRLKRRKLQSRSPHSQSQSQSQRSTASSVSTVTSSQFSTSSSQNQSTSSSQSQSTSSSQSQSTSSSQSQSTSSSQSQSTNFSQSQSTNSSQSQSQPSLNLSTPVSEDTDDPDLLKPSKKEKEINQHSMCKICYVREKDAAFVHNKIAHHYCCYSCADKILKKDGKCPICRKRVLRVVKIISA